ncbi:hypothetical protein F5Y15DRAFT_381748 [Xylariaceae sp. FL0016]|nr:hypothetical protein F5Y15DRAFT_381748 [Xylariaceae sp. FL0016]
MSFLPLLSLCSLVSFQVYYETSTKIRQLSSSKSDYLTPASPSTVFEHRCASRARCQMVGEPTVSMSFNSKDR